MGDHGDVLPDRPGGLFAWDNVRQAAEMVSEMKQIRSERKNNGYSSTRIHEGPLDLGSIGMKQLRQR
jgi:hypothetical protein